MVQCREVKFVLNNYTYNASITNMLTNLQLPTNAETVWPIISKTCGRLFQLFARSDICISVCFLTLWNNLPSITVQSKTIYGLFL